MIRLLIPKREPEYTATVHVEGAKAPLVIYSDGYFCYYIKHASHKWRICCRADMSEYMWERENRKHRFHFNLCQNVRDVAFQLLSEDLDYRTFTMVQRDEHWEVSFNSDPEPLPLMPELPSNGSLFH